MDHPVTAGAAPRELYVYYHVRSSAATNALAAVQRLQRDLRARHPGLIARLLRRPDAADGVQTWMETYALDPARAAHGIDAALQADIEAHAGALQPLLGGPRHVEVFIALD